MVAAWRPLEPCARARGELGGVACKEVCLALAAFGMVVESSMAVW